MIPLISASPFGQTLTIIMHRSATVGPLLLTLTALVLLRFAYFWQRKAAYARRERRRKEHPAAKLDIPSGLKKRSSTTVETLCMRPSGSI